MPNAQRKSLELPDEERPIPNGKVEIWHLGDFVIGRATFNPGWKWSVDVQPIAGTEWCEYHHLGLMLEGQMHFVTSEGLEMELKAGHIYEILPQHDAWVVGDEPFVVVDWFGASNYAKR